MKELIDKLYLCNKKKEGIYDCKLFKSYTNLIEYCNKNKITDSYIISIEDDRYKNIDDYLIKTRLQNELVKEINII